MKKHAERCWEASHAGQWVEGRGDGKPGARSISEQPGTSYLSVEYTAFLSYGPYSRKAVEQTGFKHNLDT